MHVTKESLKELANKFTEPEMLKEIEFLLEHRDFHRATEIIMEAILSRWASGETSEGEARQAIWELDLGPKDMADLKTRFTFLQELF